MVAEYMHFRVVAKRSVDSVMIEVERNSHLTLTMKLPAGQIGELELFGMLRFYLKKAVQEFLGEVE